ncbi:M48 family metallopeptidase [soil metagenome]
MAVDFFEAQDQAKSLSRKLVLLYGLAVAGLVLGVYLVTLVALGVSGVQEPGAEGMALFNPGLFMVVALGMGVLIGGGASFRTAQLRKGGSAVAELLGGRRVDPGSTDPKEQMLLNVVEEMAIASGVPVPEVFVMDRETGINAFAAGHTLNDAAVAVTRGALDAFTRDELQGVMAHEFSHILNGDMRLNVRLMGLLFGILLLTVVGRGIVRGGFYSGGGRSRRSSGGKEGGGGQIVLIGIALVVLGYLGVLAGRLIQAAVSRQREFLADAAAVQFTRNPDGIANALKRIGGADDGSRLNDHHAEEASHLFFARGTRKALSGLTSTHPPLAERIRRVEPGWDGNFEIPPARRSRTTEPRRTGSGEPTRPAPGGLGIPGMPGGMPGGASGGMGVLMATILASAGTLEAGQVQEARRVLSAIPDETRTRLRTPEGAMEGVLALVLPTEPEARERALAATTRRLGERPAQGAAKLQPLLAGVGAEARLPLLELSLPALRSLPRERGTALRDLIAELLGDEANEGRVRPFGFALYHLVRRNLPPGVEADPASRRGGSTPLSRLLDEAGVVLSLLAWSGAGPDAGTGDPDAAARAEMAFRAGTALLPGEGKALRLLPQGGTNLEAVDTALSRLERAANPARREFLAAAAAVVEADGRIDLAEAELLRAVAEALEVPIPPIRIQSTGPGPTTEEADMNG